MPKISVVLAVYNVEKYLPKCLDSLLGQSLSDIQIICVDDCSTDNSLEILNQYAQKDSRIEVINMKQNSGPGIARNEGLKLVKGEFIAIVDPDDWVLPNYLMNLYQKAIVTNAELVETGNLVYKNGRFKKDNRWVNVKNKKVPCTWKTMGKDLFVNLGPVIKLYKTSLIHDNEIYFGICRICEDQIFVIKSRILANKICFLDKYEYVYRCRMSSITRTQPIDSLSAEVVINDVKNFLEEVCLYDELLDYYNEYVMSVSIEKAKELLDEEIYKKILAKLEKEGKPTLLEWIFSVRNKGAYKILVIFGFEFKLFRVAEE